jgi:hypothetical protein
LARAQGNCPAPVRLGKTLLGGRAQKPPGSPGGGGLPPRNNYWCATINLAHARKVPVLCFENLPAALAVAACQKQYTHKGKHITHTHTHTHTHILSRGRPRWAPLICYLWINTGRDLPAVFEPSVPPQVAQAGALPKGLHRRARGALVAAPMPARGGACSWSGHACIRRLRGCIAVGQTTCPMVFFCEYHSVHFISHQSFAFY